MILDYENIVKQNKDGITYKQIWEWAYRDIKYNTFMKAVQHYIKTGKERNIRDTSIVKGLRSRVNIFDELHDGGPSQMGMFEEGKTTKIKIDGSEEWVKVQDIKTYEGSTPIFGVGIAVDPVVTTPYKTKDEILKLLKKGCKSSDIGPDPFLVSDILNDLTEDGYLIDHDTDQGIFTLATTTKKTDNHFHKEWDGSRRIMIGIVSDTHMGNVNHQLTFLHQLYDRYQEEGITDVYHAGDLTDGWYPNRSDQVYELHVLGADNQVNYVCANYPKREGITTHFIIGNHDYTFIRNTGYNIGPAIAMRRPDMNYLGNHNARVWLTPNCDMELNHPLDGTAYALSYSIQKYIDSMSGGDKPKILINGHHHKYLTMFYRNIHAIECPCVEAQTPFMKGKRIAAHIGGLILDINVTEDGTIERFNVELIPLYKTIKDDYTK